MSDLSTWDYRVVRFRSPVSPDSDETQEVFGVVEVYYDSDGRQRGYSAPTSTSPYGESLEELAADLELMRSALDRPVIDEADLR